MSISRRGFLQGTGGALIAFFPFSRLARNQILPVHQGLRQTLPARSVAPSNQKWVMVIDLTKCDGCGDCTKACNAMHFVPPMQEWIRVYEVTDNPAAGPYFLARPCMQCDNPPCVRGCPVGATFKRTDGIVMMDQDRCIGCRNCIAQCPYGARSFNWCGTASHGKRALSTVFDGIQLSTSQGRGGKVHLLSARIARRQTPRLRREMHHGRHLFWR